jgi:methionyl-tRNA synthetase
MLPVGSLGRALPDIRVLLLISVFLLERPRPPQKLHEYLGYDGQLFGTQHVVEYQEETRSHQALTYDHSGAVGTWVPRALLPGQALREPAPLFKKLDEGVVEGTARLEG